MIRLFVRGRNDGKIREVEHVPVSKDKRISWAGSKHVGGLLRDYYNMRIHADNGQLYKCIVREDRIETMNIPDAARMTLYGRKHG